MKILFICSKNKWRSRTAETIFRNTPGHKIQSAGIDIGARVKLTEKHLAWADLIFVMETKHRDIIRQKFHEYFDKERIIVLNIPDEYQYMDEELVQELKSSVSPFL